MTGPVGNHAARRAFDAALAGGSLHHGWLIAGPEGVGKAAFARDMAVRLLARDGGAASQDEARALLDAGSHPRFRRLARLPKDDAKPENGLARSITVDQVRKLQSLLARTVDPGERRIVLIDSIDDLERSGGNALLKSLEEPPKGTVFLLVSHVPGRLLPTIRSRCRLLRFAALEDAEVETVLRARLPDAADAEIAAMVRAGGGSPGRALAFAGLELAAIERDLEELAQHGDPANQVRSRLAKTLGAKAAQPRYAAFLERVPGFIAEHARQRRGEALRIALDAHVAAGNVAGAAIGLSQDAGATVFEMAGIVARLARTG